jgi:triosephosphate isomerase
MQNAKKTVVGNWKMNLNVPESLAHLGRLSELIKNTDGVEVVLCPTFLSLLAVRVKGRDKFRFGAQNCSASDSGARTGEVSASMLKGIAEYVIVGHSERRQIFHETDGIINQKLLAAIHHGIRPILCIGEEQNQPAEDVLRSQIDGGLHSVRPNVLDQIIIAYEPIWAIGSGRTPTVDDIASAANIIRSQIKYMYGRDAKIRVLYGGSVDENNALEILGAGGVDGLLVGGASLNPQKFATIVEIASRVGDR